MSAVLTREEAPTKATSSGRRVRPGGGGGLKRQTLVLLALVGLLLVVGFYFLAFQPQRQQLADVEEQIVHQQDQQVALQTQLDRLRAVREQAPEIEAQLAASEAIIPRDPAIPSALRQLQVAAEEANLVLHTVTAARPQQVEGATTGLSSIILNVQLQGSYFQVVDFLRRIEDPSISPRGALWSALTVSKDEYPLLNVSLGGTLYTLLPEPPPAIEETPADDAGDADDTTDGAQTEGEL